MTFATVTNIDPDAPEPVLFFQNNHTRELREKAAMHRARAELYRLAGHPDYAIGSERKAARFETQAAEIEARELAAREANPLGYMIMEAIADRCASDMEALILGDAS